MLQYLESFRYRLLNNAFALIVVLVMTSVFAYGTVFAVVYTVLIGAVFGLFAKRRVLVEAVLPGAIAYFLVTCLYLFTPSGLELFPVSIQLLLVVVSTLIGVVLAFIGGLISLPFRRYNIPERLLAYLNGKRYDTSPPGPHGKNRTGTSVQRQKKDKATSSSFSDMLKRITVVTLFAYVTMHMLVPFLARVSAAETYSVDEYAEQYDPTKKIEVQGKDKPGPVQQDMVVDTTDVSSKDPAKNNQLEEYKKLTPEQKKLEELKKKNLKLEQLKKLYEQKKITEKEFLELLLYGKEKGTIKTKDLFTKENYNWLVKNLNKKFPNIAKALQDAKKNWWKVWKWPQLEIQLLAAIDKDVFNGAGARVVQTTGKVLSGAADAVADGVTGAVTFVVEHPVEAVIMVGAVVTIAVAVVVSPVVATIVTAVGVLSILGTAFMIGWNLALDGPEGVMAMFFSEETLALLAAKDEGAWGRIPVELAGYVLLNWPENPYVALTAISTLGKAFNAARKAGKIGDAVKLLMDMRKLAAMGKNAGAITQAGYDALLAMGKLAAVKGAGTLDELSRMMNYALMDPQMALALSVINKSGESAQDLAKVSDEAVDGMLLNEMDGLMDMGKVVKTVEHEGEELLVNYTPLNYTPFTPQAYRKLPLNWKAIVSKSGETREEHVMLHKINIKRKEDHGVFYGDPIDVTNKAWAKKGNIKPIVDGNNEVYYIPYSNSGYAGGLKGQGQNLTHVTIVVQRGTNNIITSFPSYGYSKAPRP